MKKNIQKNKCSKTEMFSKKLLTQKLQINQFPYLKKDSEKKLPYLYKKKDLS